MGDVLTGHSVTMVDGKSSASCVDLKSAHREHASNFDTMITLRRVQEQRSNILYWASAANPFHGMTSFAIAASNGALTLSESQGRWTTAISERYLGAPQVVAVDWLSPNVVMKGCEDGGVRLWDTRSHGESRGSRIKHPSQIIHARRVDEHTIVVAGFASEVTTSIASGFQIC